MASELTIFNAASRALDPVRPLGKVAVGAIADICLRSREARDAGALFKLFSQPLCRFGLITDPFVNVADLERRLNPNCPDGFEIVAAKADSAVGYGALFPCPGTRGHVGWISLFVHDEFHGRGIGDLLMRAIITTADVAYALDRVELAVRAGNGPALALYRKYGFEVEGLHKAFARRDGVDIDVLTMARLANRLRPRAGAGISSTS
jgi:putative acetyltransferase